MIEGIVGGFIITIFAALILGAIMDWAFKRRDKQDWNGVILELSGKEGFSYSDLEATGVYAPDGKGKWGYRMNGVWVKPDECKPVHLYVKVIGLRDDIAPIRNWGRVTLKG